MVKVGTRKGTRPWHSPHGPARQRGGSSLRAEGTLRRV